MSGAASDRNAGTNAGRIQGQIAQIRNWMDGADYEGMAGDIDRVLAEIDLRAEIDPTLSAGDNWRIIKNKYGLMTASDRQREARRADAKAEQSARRAIRENLAAIESGDPEGILDDVAAEYGREFAEVELSRAQADADPELGGAPEPNAHNPSSVAGANGTPGESSDPTPAPTADPSPARENTSARESLIPPADDGRPSPSRTPAPVEADSTGSKRVVLTKALRRVTAPLRDLFIGFVVLPREHPELLEGGSADV